MKSIPGPKLPTARGAWTIAAIFAVAIAVTVGLFLSPRSKSPPVPTGMVEGLPDQPVKIAFVDGSGIGPQPQRLIDAIARLDRSPQVIMLVGVDSSVLSSIAEVFSMQGSFHPQLYQRVKRSDGTDRRGVCILAKSPLYEGSPVKTEDGRIVGVRAVATIDGKSFRLTCLDADVPFVEADGAPKIGFIAAAGPDAMVATRYAGTVPWSIEMSPWRADLPPGTLITLRPRPTPETAPAAGSRPAAPAAP